MGGGVDGLLQIVGISLAISFVTFWGFGGLVHWWFYVRRRSDAARWKVQPECFLRPRLFREAFWLGSLNMGIGAVVGGVFAWHVARGGWSTTPKSWTSCGTWWPVRGSKTAAMTRMCGWCG